jgi:hypothetical protein
MLLLYCSAKHFCPDAVHIFKNLYPFVFFFNNTKCKK